MPIGTASLIRKAVRGRLVLAVMVGGALLGAVGDSAGAFQIFGRKFFEREDETAVTPDAQPYTLDVHIKGDKDVTTAVRDASTLIRDEKHPPPGAAGLIARARGDYGRILAALYASGRYGGTVRIRVQGQPVETLQPDAMLPNPATVEVNVDPGPLFRFGAIRIDGAPPGPMTAGDEAALKLSDWPLAKGAEARSGAILAAEGRLVDVWNRRGYPKAQIATREILADHRADTVDVRLAVDPGPVARFGAVEITGTERMDPDFVRRETGLKPGERYDPEALKRARDRLQRLGVFSSISVVEADAVTPDGTLPLTFKLSERKRRVIGGGAAYSTLEGAMLEGYWMQRNLFGHAESLRFDAAVSRIGAEDLEGTNYSAAVTFRRPGTFTPDTDLTLQVLGKREFLDTYESRTAAARAGLEHLFSPELTGTTAINIERDYIEDPFGKNTYSILSLPSTLDYDARDNKLDPTRGLRGTLQAEPLYEADRSTGALVAQGSLAGYFSLDQRDRIVVAGRGMLGSIVGGSLQDIPATRRFYLGGGGSIRGYDYRSIGPEIDGQVVGGLSFWGTSLEVRAKVTDTIGIVPFVDVGAAYPDPIPDFASDVRVGAGVGLRYFTPLGPLRFDVAVPLTRRHGDPSVAFYVGLGQSF